MSKKKDVFKGSNGFVIEVHPAAGADAPWTEKELASVTMRPAKEALPPKFFKAWDEMKQKRGRGRPKKDTPKLSTTLRLDADILKAFRARGKGWQSRMNVALRDWLSTHPMK
jgi:uncharacterized protein (DUF4415 family)